MLLALHEHSSGRWAQIPEENGRISAAIDLWPFGPEQDGDEA